VRSLYQVVARFASEAAPLPKAVSPSYMWGLPPPAPRPEGRPRSRNTEGALPALFILYLAVTFAAVLISSQLAPSKNRNIAGWMWACAVFPPLVLVLALLPKRTGTSLEVRA